MSQKSPTITLRTAIVPDAKGALRHMSIGIRTTTNIQAPILCCSLLAPAIAISGCVLTRQVGGYAEFQLPDIVQHVDMHCVIAYQNDDFFPVNRAWLPMGCYLRLHDGTWQSLYDADKPLGKAFRWLVLQEHLPLHSSTNQHDFNGYLLLPQPSEVKLIQGQVLVVDGFAVTCQDFSDSFTQIQRLDVRQNLGVFTSGDTPLRICKAVARDDCKDSDTCSYLVGHTGVTPNNCQYTLHIDIDKGIQISCTSALGAFYGLISLLWLVVNHKKRLPCGKIIDKPKASWRGMHLDCARHFFATQTLCDMLDLMALLKLNIFHWHMCDDEAFRIELDVLRTVQKPQCTQRGEHCMIPGVFGGGVSAGGSYSKADVVRIVEHARNLHIDVMPELDVPAHMYCLMQAIESLREPNDTSCAPSVQGYVGNVLNPALASTWQLLDSILCEMSLLFPYDIVHLGGDELPDGCWSGSKLVQNLMAKQGLQNQQDVLAWTMRKLAKIAQKYGFRVAAWEEAAQGMSTLQQHDDVSTQTSMQAGIGNDALIFAWDKKHRCIQAVQDGYKVVMCSASHLYLDMAQTKSPQDWGASWAGCIDFLDTIDWQVVLQELVQQGLQEKVIGIQACLWSESITEDKQLWSMLLPRLLGVAALAWQQYIPKTQHQNILTIATLSEPMFAQYALLAELS